MRLVHINILYGHENRPSAITENRKRRILKDLVACLSCAVLTVVSCDFSQRQHLEVCTFCEVRQVELSTTDAYTVIHAVQAGI